MISPAYLQHYEELAEKATAGPWKFNGRWEVSGRQWIADTRMLLTSAMRWEPHETTASNNAAFIAASRTAVPELCAEVRRLQKSHDGLHLTCSNNAEQIGKLEIEVRRLQADNARMRAFIEGLEWVGELEGAFGFWDDCRAALGGGDV